MELQKKGVQPQGHATKMGLYYTKSSSDSAVKSCKVCMWVSVHEVGQRQTTKESWLDVCQTVGIFPHSAPSPQDSNHWTTQTTQNILTELGVAQMGTSDWVRASPPSTPSIIEQWSATTVCQGKSRGAA